MIKKVYAYKLTPGGWDAFVDLQRRADALYRKHVNYEIAFVRDRVDPSRVTEIHTYSDLAAATRAESLHNLEPELGRLFVEFQKLLDPAHPEVMETVGEEMVF